MEKQKLAKRVKSIPPYLLIPVYCFSSLGTFTTLLLPFLRGKSSKFFDGVFSSRFPSKAGLVTPVELGGEEVPGVRETWGELIATEELKEEFGLKDSSSMHFNVAEDSVDFMVGDTATSSKAGGGGSRRWLLASLWGFVISGFPLLS